MNRDDLVVPGTDTRRDLTLRVSCGCVWYFEVSAASTWLVMWYIQLEYRHLRHVFGRKVHRRKNPEAGSPSALQ